MKDPTDRPRTAADLVRELEGDPDYNARRSAKDAARAKLAEEVAFAEADLVEGLRAIGVDVGTVWDLVTHPTPRPAVPRLVDYLARGSHPRVREGVARALIGSELTTAEWSSVLRAFSLETVHPVRFAIANVLAADLATADRVRRLAPFIADERFGGSRIPLLAAVAIVDCSESRRIMRAARGDPELKPHCERIDRLLSGHGEV